MAILAECFQCHAKQKTSNKRCKCGADLDKGKKARKVKFWISYRLEGKQRRECVGTSIEEARDALGKRMGQRRENRIFEMMPESRMDFRELAKWFLNLSTVKALKTHKRLTQCLNAFNAHFGSRTVETIKAVDLEDYAAARAAQGLKPATIQMELMVAGSVVNRAFLNDMVSGRTLKAFKVAKKPMRRGENARTRTITLEEYRKLLGIAPANLRAILTLAMRTGMRRREMVRLRRSNLDRSGFIRLTADQTKEGKPKVIPIDRTVMEILNAQPKALHHDFVFTYRGDPLGENSMTFAMERACKKAGIPYGEKVEGGLRLHDIRATVKTGMVKAGVDKSLRDVILGHTSRDMDRVYLRFDDKDLAEAMARYTRWLDDQMQSVDQTDDQEAQAV